MIMMGLLVYVVGFLSFMMNAEHILMLFMCLEFMYLGVLYNVIVIFGESGIMLDVIIFMIVVVCEAGLSLSILVLGVYFYGNDSNKILNLLKC
uniref:NADH dehydrogenase subunit 4L n=1 Tax=Ornithodoros zumpti TaxID=1827026 RepID=A0A1P8AGG6_9ACAR|nr:NADH dehydrogenase subunit 4L [Ornithodoros zumpti]